MTLGTRFPVRLAVIAAALFVAAAAAHSPSSAAPVEAVAVEGTPGALAVDPQKKHLFASLRSNSTLASFRIDPATGTATKLFNLVGSNLVMGLAFGRDGKLYATDFVQNSGLYRIDPATGFQTAIAALPFGFSSGLELTG